MGGTSGPDIAFFIRFREIWTKLNKKIYMTSSNEVPGDVRSTILGFFEYHLSTQEQQLASTDNLSGYCCCKINFQPSKVLIPEIVALSIFDDRVPIEFKSNITQVMLEVDKGKRPEEKINTKGTV